MPSYLETSVEIAREAGALLSKYFERRVTFELKGEHDLVTEADRASEQLVVERLSAREREVLAHASEMLSTAEIATEMYLSVNTVKTHLRSIYRKLSATHRSEAVRRAQQLELI